MVCWRLLNELYLVWRGYGLYTGVNMSDLLTRAREYVKDGYLDLADVRKFAEAFVTTTARYNILKGFCEEVREVIDPGGNWGFAFLGDAVRRVISENKTLRARVKELESMLP